MRIGYCSPLNPIKSGISDFSEELLLALKEQMEIVVFSEVPPVNPEISEHFETHALSELNNDRLRKSLDLIVYHIGNNANGHAKIVEMLRKYPGVVELHDIGLHHLAAEEADRTQNWQQYVELAEYCHGQRGKQIAQDYLSGKTGAPWEEHPLDMCMNRYILDHGTAIIVHSDMAKQVVLSGKPNVPVQHIPHHSILAQEPLDQLQTRCRKELNLPEAHLVFGSFGFASADKRIPQIIDALVRFKESYGPDFRYCIVGAAAEHLHLEETLQRLQLEEQVLVTGFVTLDDFTKYMGACDFCLNLRYPTRGESSGSLHRMLGMGKPAIVTDIGTFSEYPDDIVRKVRYDEHEADDICAAMLDLANEKKQFNQLAQRVYQYAFDHFSLETNAVRYKTFFEQVLNHTWQPDWMDLLVDRLIELNLTSPEYTAHICELLKEYRP